MSYQHEYSNGNGDHYEEYDEDWSVLDAVDEASRLLAAGRRTTIAAFPHVHDRRASTLSRPSSLYFRRRSTTAGGEQIVAHRNHSILGIDYHDMQHLLMLDQELDTSRHSLLVHKEPLDEERCARVLRRMRQLTCIASIGGFLSGYNTGVISGALLPLTRVFDLSPEQQESLVSATILFAFIASVVGGAVNQAIGRKLTIMSAAAIFTLGALLLFQAQNYFVLIVGEIILGIGIGFESLTSPMYIAEVAKPSCRGMLVSAYAFMMCFGQFFAGVVDGICGGFHSGWRYMFGTAMLPSMVMFFGFLDLPESPTWLLAAGQDSHAEQVLKEIRDCDEDAKQECEEIRLSIQTLRSDCGEGDNNEDDAPPSLRQMLQKQPARRALIVGCSLMLLQQFCGANVVMYYAATIYRLSGFGELAAIWLSAFTALAQLIGLALSVMLVETAGRRPLMLVSLTGVALCLLGLGWSFWLARIMSEKVVAGEPDCMTQRALVWDGVTRYAYDCVQVKACGFCGGVCTHGTPDGPEDASACPDDSPWEYDVSSTPAWVGMMPVLFMVAYLVIFGIGVAGLPWTINGEIYPVQYRSIAVSISTGMNWICNLIISSTFLTISDASVLTIYGSFWLYSVISILGVVWIYFMLPETKGLNMDQIQEEFRVAQKRCPDVVTQEPSYWEKKPLSLEQTQESYNSLSQ